MSYDLFIYGNLSVFRIYEFFDFYFFDLESYYVKSVKEDSGYILVLYVHTKKIIK